MTDQPEDTPIEDTPIEDTPIEDAPVEVLHRRAPRYGRFILTGLLLGGIASFVSAIATRGWSGLSTSNTFWLLLLALGVVGMLLGATVALLVDRRSIAALEAEAAAAREETSR